MQNIPSTFVHLSYLDFFVCVEERFFLNSVILSNDSYFFRLMYLKRRYELGYETLAKEVKDSFTCRCFCHLALKD